MSTPSSLFGHVVVLIPTSISIKNRNSRFGQLSIKLLGTFWNSGSDDQKVWARMDLNHGTCQYFTGNTEIVEILLELGCSMWSSDFESALFPRGRAYPFRGVRNQPWISLESEIIRARSCDTAAAISIPEPTSSTSSSSSSSSSSSLSLSPPASPASPTSPSSSSSPLDQAPDFGAIDFDSAIDDSVLLNAIHSSLDMPAADANAAVDTAPDSESDAESDDSDLHRHNSSQSVSDCEDESDVEIDADIHVDHELIQRIIKIQETNECRAEALANDFNRFTLKLVSLAPRYKR
jgi:hypothetical protein